MQRLGGRFDVGGRNLWLSRYLVSVNWRVIGGWDMIAASRTGAILYGNHSRFRWLHFMEWGMRVKVSYVLSPKARLSAYKDAYIQQKQLK
jgi:hypothetical protein